MEIVRLWTKRKKHDIKSSICPSNKGENAKRLEKKQVFSELANISQELEGSDLTFNDLEKDNDD